jgi:hypothetical protein
LPAAPLHLNTTLPASGVTVELRLTQFTHASVLI